MERYEFEMIPVPAEALNAVGITPRVTVEAFADGSRMTSVKHITMTARAVLTAAPAAANA